MDCKGSQAERYPSNMVKVKDHYQLCFSCLFLNWPSSYYSLCWPMATMSTKMYKTSFWMKHFGGVTPKRTCLWSWSWGVSIFNKGKLRRAQLKSAVKTAVAYTDGKGKRRWKGTTALKGTQYVVSNNHVGFCNTSLETVKHLLNRPPPLTVPLESTSLLRIYTPSFAAAVLGARRTLRKTRSKLPEALFSVKRGSR